MKNKINYIVSGFPRSGTSMMMQILRAGGMTIVYDKEIDKKRDKWIKKDYNPNPQGYFEKNFHLSKIDSFLKSVENKAFKINPYVMRKLPIGEYKIIFMTRCESERKSSFNFSFGINKSITSSKDKRDVKREIPDLFIRDDLDILFLDYKEVVENPISEISKIYEFLNINFNKKEAVKIINPLLYRFVDDGKEVKKK